MVTLKIHTNNENKYNAKINSIDNFPSLPARQHYVMLQESILGWLFVLILIGIFVGITHGATVPKLPAKDGAIALVLIYIEAFVAFCSLLGITFGNPGEIGRSEKNSFPLPDKVEEHIREKISFHGMENIQQGRKTYCVRCFVWRPEGSHHCSICQRCVIKFDHHCGVFGRCIAGSWGFHCPWHGNLFYFKMIIYMGFAGFITCLIFAMRGVYYERAMQPP